MEECLKGSTDPLSIHQEQYGNLHCSTIPKEVIYGGNSMNCRSAKAADWRDPLSGSCLIGIEALRLSILGNPGRASLSGY